MGNQESDPLSELSILIDGDHSIGKTSLISAYLNGEGGYNLNQGKDKYTKNVKLFQKWINLNIWDVVGPDHLKVLKERYTKSCEGILLCFDIGNKNSFKSLEDHLKAIQIYVKDYRHILIAGLKSDVEEREVTCDEAKIWAQSKGFNYIETSAKEMRNIDEVFEEIFSEMIILKQKKIMEDALNIKS